MFESATTAETSVITALPAIISTVITAIMTMLDYCGGSDDRRGASYWSSDDAPAGATTWS